jgi:lipid-binding SYLF domain-containing protein
MRRAVHACLLLLASLGAAQAQSAQQALVDRATLTLQDILLNNPAGDDARSLLMRSRGVMICPRVFKAGFFFGGQGGDCVLVGRGQVGWSPPAFYGIGGGSFGLQAGIQDSEIIMIILTERGLRALLDDQFKIGGDASLAFATVGIGVSGATTAAFRGDIVAYENNRGLFAGISLNGSMIGARSEWNSAYYGQMVAPQQIVLQGAGNNPGANPLREVLARYSGPVTAPPAPPPPVPYAALPPNAYSGMPPQPPGPMPLAPPPTSGAVQAMPLPPPVTR